MINATIIVVYLVGTVMLGLYLSRYVKTDSDFFLAGRSLNKWVIAGAIMATDIAALYLVAPAGNAFRGGVPILFCGWSGNMIAAVSALFFVPRLRRLQITTIPEILEERYNVWIRLFPTVLWIIYYALFSGILVYTFAVMVEPISDFERDTVILFVGGGVILYCFVSGLLAVAYTDVIQTFLIVLGGVIILPLSLKAAGGIHEIIQNTPTEYFLFWRMDDTDITYKTLIMFILIGFPYWCTSQYMLQWCMAGRSVRDASRGLMLAALFTGSVTFAYIVPGLAGYVLYSSETLQESDAVLIRLFQDVLPVGLGGLFIAALLAANISTLSTMLNALSTLAVNDIYRRFVPDKTSGHYMWIGRLATICGGIGGLLFAFRVGEFKGIIDAVFQIMSLFEPPIFVVIAGGLLWRGANSWGAALAGIGGVAYTISAFYMDVSMEDRTFIAFPLCIFALIVGSWAGRIAHPPTVQTMERIESIFARMQGEPIRWDIPQAWFGLALALASLVAMTLVMVDVDLVPRPMNVLAVMGFVATWVLGLYLAIPMFVSEQAPEAEHEVSSVETSLIYKLVGSGWSWLAFFTASIVFMFVLYFM